MQPCCSVHNEASKLPLSTEEMNCGDLASRVRVSYQFITCPRYLGRLASVPRVFLVRSIISGTVIKPNSLATWREFKSSPMLVGETRAAIFRGSSCPLSGISQWCSAVEDLGKQRQ